MMKENISLEPAATRMFSADSPFPKVSDRASRNLLQTELGYSETFVAAWQMASTTLGDGPSGFSFEDNFRIFSRWTPATLEISAVVGPGK